MIDEQQKFLDCRTFSCADMELLVNYYVDGELLEALHGQFHNHLHACEGCQELLAECEALISLARSLDSNPIPPSVSRRLREAIREQTGCDLINIRPKLSLVKGNSSA